MTSTFGNGDPPRSAEKIAEWIDQEMNLNEQVCILLWMSFLLGNMKPIETHEVNKINH